MAAPKADAGEAAFEVDPIGAELCPKAEAPEAPRADVPNADGFAEEPKAD